MKKLLILIVALAFLASPVIAGAGTLTFGQADLLTWNKIMDNPVGTASVDGIAPKDLNSIWIYFHLAQENNPQSGFKAVQFGWQFDKNEPGFAMHGYDNLTGYDKYGLILSNESCTPIMANLFMNTGWTDPPYDATEGDHYYQNDWTWIPSGEETTLWLDMTNMVYLNHTTAIGVNFGLNYIEGNSVDYYDFDPIKQFQVDVDPVPIPSAILLLGSGLFGLIGLRRKFQS